jgi:hypothetical protein
MHSEDYAQLHLKNVAWIDGLPWQCDNRMLLPFAMPHRISPVDRRKVRQAMAKAKCLVAMWNDQWDTAQCDWWHVCADGEQYDVELLPKNGRRDIRAGLRRCQVRRVTHDFLAEHGYDVHAAAFKTYSGAANCISAEAFAALHRGYAGIEGREAWGAFINDSLIAYANCIALDDAATLATVKSHPDHLHALPNNALIYTLTCHYLVERRLRYVDSGARSLLHDTNMQDFLQRMGYRKIYCPLRIEISPLLAWAFKAPIHQAAQSLRLDRVAPGIYGRLTATAAARNIAKSCEYM